VTLIGLSAFLIIIPVYLLYRFVIPARFKHFFLAIVSALFILFQNAPNIWANALFTAVTLFALVAAHYSARKLAGKPLEETRGPLRNGIIIVLIPLVVFKFIGIFSAPLSRMAVRALPGFELQLLAPLGISYLTFRLIAYLIDVRRGAVAPASFIDLFVYAAFWPTLLSGPIERPAPFMEQLKAMPRAKREDLSLGLGRVALGAFKALLLGGMFGKMAQPILALDTQPGFLSFLTISVPGLWLCVISYYFHLYLNFAGYSDIAIGFSRMLGYGIRENFNWPFLAPNIADFWRRWHMSLTGWITDYVYIPMGGGQAGLRRAAKNTLIAMLLVGAWHGFSMHFLWWGAYHACLLILYRLWRKKWRTRFNIPDNFVTRFCSTLLTFILVALGWVIFVMPMSMAVNVFLKLFGLAFTSFSPELLQQ
jgi:alginate O-acetyltransferase complex protein AlgI